MNKNEVYSMKETRDKTGLTNDLLRLYEKEFNLQIERTDGGHRRYTEEDINLLINIKLKIKDQNWSYKQVRQWLNGDAPQLNQMQREDAVKSNIEKKLDKMLENQEDQKYTIDLLTETVRKLTEKLDAQEERHVKQIEDQRVYFEQKLEEKNKDVVKEVRLLQSAKEEEGRSFFSKLFKKG
jgi:DNA-binding transcriptional MerR regulator